MLTDFKLRINTYLIFFYNTVRCLFKYVILNFIIVSVNDLPPGVALYIDIRAYKNLVLGDPFTIPLTTEGVRDETLNLTAILLKEKGNSVQLTWLPPTNERYKNKNLSYEVHYTNVVNRFKPGELFNGEFTIILILG